jgi:23S rRNA (guanine745-N1)-methyltransferase
VPAPPLACSVRGCGLPLDRFGRAYRCARGHAFDLARTGHLNLLQPQDRRSATPGDSRALVDARTRVSEEGVERRLIDAVVECVSTLALPPGAVVVDLGSGVGACLTRLAERLPITGIGIDLSVVAAERAARRSPHLTWIVANVDRRLPLLDRSVDLVLSINARRHPDECARVLVPRGRLLIAVPAEDDLYELRAAVLGRTIPRQRLDAVLKAHASSFSVVERWTIRDRQRLEPPVLLALLRSTYRGARSREAERAAALSALDVTMAFEIALFEVR